jgi:hypothetical protein
MSAYDPNRTFSASFDHLIGDGIVISSDSAREARLKILVPPLLTLPRFDHI